MPRTAVRTDKYCTKQVLINLSHFVTTSINKQMVLGDCVIPDVMIYLLHSKNTFINGMQHLLQALGVDTLICAVETQNMLTRDLQYVSVVIRTCQ